MGRKEKEEEVEYITVDYSSLNMVCYGLSSTEQAAVLTLTVWDKE